MKLKPFDHFFAIVIALVMFLLFVGAAILFWIPGLATDVFSNVLAITSIMMYRIIISVVAAIFAFLCLRVLFVRKREKGEKAPPPPDGIMLRSGEHGSSFVTLGAIDALVKKHVRSNQKVRDCKVKVLPTDDHQNLILDLNVVLMPEISIPETCTELQDSLSSYIQEMTGIMVREVKITVDDSTEPVQTSKTRTVK